MPFGVAEWGVDVVPASWIVYQDHPGNRKAPESVQRHESVGVCVHARCGSLPPRPTEIKFSRMVDVLGRFLSTPLLP